MGKPSPPPCSFPRLLRPLLSKRPDAPPFPAEWRRPPLPSSIEAAFPLHRASAPSSPAALKGGRGGGWVESGMAEQEEGERQKSGYRFSLFPSLERFGEEQNAVRPCYALVCWPLDAADAADEGKRTQRSGSTTIAWRKRSEGGFPLHPSH